MFTLLLQEDIILLSFGITKCSKFHKPIESVPKRTPYQGREFTHWFSEQIARFLPKNERFAHVWKAT